MVVTYYSYLNRLCKGNLYFIVPIGNDLICRHIKLMNLYSYM